MNMQMQTSRNDGAERPPSPTGHYAVGAVVSKDGTRIGYRRIGRGPGLIIVQGAFGTVHNYDQLGRAVADEFTVYCADRRGRGMSPCVYSPATSSIQREVEDVDALLTESDAHLMFGLSSGGLITLECARVLPSVRKAVVYEPAFYVHGVPRDLIARFHDEVTHERLSAALVTVNDIVKLAPGVLRFIPRPLLELATRAILQREEKRGSGAYAPLKELLPSMRFDFQVAEERGGQMGLFKSVQAPILLLGGTKSPTFLKDALQTLTTILPNSQRAELAGLDHSGPWNVDRGGAPEVVARSMHSFLSDNRQEG